MIVQKATREIVLLRRLLISTAAFYVSSPAGSIESTGQQCRDPATRREMVPGAPFPQLCFLVA